MNPQELCNEAERYLEAGEGRRAVLLLKKHAHRPFADLRVRSLYGLALARADSSFYGFYRGLKWCGQALEQRPDDPHLLVNLGKVYLFHGLRAKALEYMDRALDIAPEDPAVRASRGLLGFRQRPKIPFLARSHPLNIVLGKIAVSVKRLLSG